MVWNYYMAKTAIVVWFILLAGKPIGMSNSYEVTSMLACEVEVAKLIKINEDLKKTGADVEIYASCEQDR